jgi:hypothetical protein
MTANRAAQRQIQTQLHANLKAARTEYDSTLKRHSFEKYWQAVDNFNKFLLYAYLARAPRSKLSPLP